MGRHLTIVKEQQYAVPVLSQDIYIKLFILIMAEFLEDFVVIFINDT